MASEEPEWPTVATITEALKWRERYQIPLLVAVLGRADNSHNQLQVGKICDWLKEARLLSLVVLHVVMEGSAEAQQLQMAHPAPLPAVPFVYVFPPSTNGSAMMLVHGAKLKRGLSAAIISASRITPDGNRRMQDVVGSHFGNAVAELRQAADPGGAERRETGNATLSAPSVSEPSPGAKAHFIYFAYEGKKTVLLSQPGQTLKAMWGRADKRHSAPRTGEVDPKHAPMFFLVRRVESTTVEEAIGADALVEALPTGAVVKVVFPGQEADENEEIIDRATPQGVSHMQEPAPAPSPTLTRAAAPAVTSPPTQPPRARDAPATTPEPPRVPAALAPGAPQSPAAPANSRESPAPVPSSAPAPFRLRFSLPTGETVTLDDLDPGVVRLADVRQLLPAAAQSHESAFVSAYPPRRFRSEDELMTLQDLGITSNSVVRVVPSTRPSEPAQGAQPSQVTGLRIPGGRNLIGAAVGLMNYMRGAGSNPGPEPPQPPPVSSASHRRLGGGIATLSSLSPVHGSSSNSISRPTMRSMAEIIREREEEEQRRASEHAERERRRAPGGDPPTSGTNAGGRKSNRYYGGASTEFIGQGDDDSEGSGGLGTATVNGPASPSSRATPRELRAERALGSRLLNPTPGPSGGHQGDATNPSEGPDVAKGSESP